jgi:ribosomal protein S18 acetylase RimI-like enzyme
MRTGAVRLELSTAVTNPEAQRLYEKEGWRRDVEFLHYEFELTRGE